MQSVRSSHSRSRSGRSRRQHGYGEPRRLTVRERVAELVLSDRVPLAAFVALVLAVGFMGGGSRADITSLIVLRPLSVLLAIYALFQLTRATARPVLVPLLTVLTVMLVAAVQLVPLPHGLWSSLPGRAPVARMDELAGLGAIARPVSLDPAATWNALFATFVPLAAIALVAVQKVSARTIVLILAALATLGALMGMLQLLGLRKLYLYAITNSSNPVGLFSNRNHFSLMLAWLIAAAPWLVLTDKKLAASAQAVLGTIIFIVLLLPLVVLTGSRAGMMLSLPALGCAAIFLLQTDGLRAAGKIVRPRWRRAVGVLAALVALALVGGVLVALFASDRTTGLSRLAETNNEELRVIYLPILWQMVQDFFPAGLGLGGFERVFYAYEPIDTLTAHYMNEAHNDLAQFVMEGGLVALVLIVVGVSWIGWRTLVLVRQKRAGSRNDALFLGLGCAIFLLGSLADYPLRPPLGAMTFAILTALLGMVSRNPDFQRGAAKAVQKN